MTIDTAWPSMPGALVLARFARVHGDGTDDDDLPDWIAPVGSELTFAPSITGPLVYDSGGAKIIIEVAPFRAVVDDNGYAVARDGGHPIKLVPTDDPLMSRTGWLWTCSWAGGKVSFPAPSEGAINLADYIVAPPNNPVVEEWVARIPELVDAAGSLAGSLVGIDARVDAAMAPHIAQVQQISGLTGEDEAVAHLVQQPASGTRSALDATYPRRSHLGLAPARMSAVLVDKTAPTIVPFEMINGVIYGQAGTELHRSTDGGTTWTRHGNLPASINAVRMGPVRSGEMILVASNRIYLSAGFATATQTWTQKATTNGACQFLSWSLAGDGDLRYLTTEYAAGAGFPDSRYARMTLDGGETWSIVYDSVARYGSTAAAESHLHGCSYDPWVDRWYISEGHSEGGDIGGIYASEDNGQTWTRAEGMKMNPAPTVIIATDEGLVCSSDHTEGGIYGVVRTAIARQQLQRVWAWRPNASGLPGFGEHGYRDPETGIVYFGYQTAYAHVAPIICGGTPTAGGLVWEWVEEPGGVIAKVFPTGNGNLLAYTRHTNGSGRGTVRGRVAAMGVQNASLADTGAVLGGAANTSRLSTAGGTGSEAKGLEQTSMGGQAKATGEKGAAYGVRSLASGINSTANGTEAEATANTAAAFGYRAKANHVSSVVFPRGASTAPDQIQIGPRHLEIENHPGEAAAPAADTNKVRLYLRTGAAGLKEIRARFPGGGITRLTTEGDRSEVIARGTAGLGAGGSVAVPLPATTHGCMIRITPLIPQGTPGAMFLASKTAGTGFTVSSTNTADRSTFYYELFY